MTTAGRQAREDSYNKRLGLYGLVSGMEGPASAAVANSANAANYGANAAGRNSFLQGSQYRTDLQAQGAGIKNLVPAAKTIGNVAKQWFGDSGSSTAMTPGQVVDDYGYGYKKGGRVIDGKATRVFGPHMRRYAMGGEVEEQGLEPNDLGMPPDASQMGQLAGPGTETSDSIPAVVDGQEPAGLSTGEFVMSAEVPKMSGEEILEAINQAGLQKRQTTGLQPQAQMRSFARGGRVNRYAHAGL